MPLGDEQIDYPLPNPDENERTGIGDDGDVPIAPIEEGEESPDGFDEEEDSRKHPAVIQPLFSGWRGFTAYASKSAPIIL